MGRRKKLLLQEAKEYGEGAVAPSGPALWLVEHKGKRIEAVGQTAFYAFQSARLGLEGDPSIGEVEKMEFVRLLTKEEIANLTKEETCCRCGGSGKVRSTVR